MDFLFLSKLIPLLFYPLGLVCVLLLVCLILWWKYPRWLPIPLIGALLILILSGNFWVSNSLVKSLEWQYQVTPEEIANAEAIVILGGGIKPKIEPRPMVDLAEPGDRVIYGAKLYQMGKAPLVVATGGRIPWQNQGKILSEADDMAQILLLLGVPDSDIIREGKSLNTYDNAVYTKQILEPRDINRIILVTSATHMPRSVKIFRKQNFEVIPAPTDYLVTQQVLQGSDNDSWQNSLIKIFPRSNYLHNTTLALKEYIGLLIYRWKGWL